MKSAIIKNLSIGLNSWLAVVTRDEFPVYKKYRYLTSHQSHHILFLVKETNYCAHVRYNCSQERNQSYSLNSELVNIEQNYRLISILFARYVFIRVLRFIKRIKTCSAWVALMKKWSTFTPRQNSLKLAMRELSVLIFYFLCVIISQLGEWKLTNCNNLVIFLTFNMICWVSTGVTFWQSAFYMQVQSPQTRANYSMSWLPYLKCCLMY